MTGTIDAFALGAGLLGGLGLFLLGLRQLTDSSKRLAGDRLPTLIGRFTSNRAKAVGADIAVVQSSSITTDRLLETPSIALAAVRYELASLGEVAVGMVGRAVDATLFGTSATPDQLAA